MTGDRPDRADELEKLASAMGREMVLETTGALANVIPLVGGSISNVLVGLAGDLRWARFLEFIRDLDARLQDVTDEQRAYVEGDEFKELLAETIPRVARERGEEKRRIYARYLAAVVEEPSEPYDERLRFLRVLEELQVDHIRIMRSIALDTDPPERSVMTGSRRATLQARLPDIPADRLRDLTDQLGDLRMLDVGGLSPMVTGPSAIDLRPLVTPFGNRFIRFLSD